MLINQYYYEFFLRQQNQDTEQQKEILSRKIYEMIENGSPMLNHVKILYGGIWDNKDFKYFIEYNKALSLMEYELMMKEYKHLTVQNIFYMILCAMGKDNKAIAEIMEGTQDPVRSIQVSVATEKR